MTVRDSVAEGQMFEDEIQGGDAVPVFEGAVEEVAFEGVVYGEAEGPIFEVQSALDGDEDLLDLLVETLDGDFDPNLLV
ncbi:hypothetical protein HJC23_012347 [Cyclotella cryptica]|uniref:Uncharacterized protein n=1 Tax=Cyclotella cryptica TaxID=29204 RepID=A0ABD3QDZ4_9STRA|eukprot:CCRYP_006544-RA/>CCRYP_006544-RA protein AED:0.47 eAED:0.47 QI:0/-1/0/1/-1/1/1/0/78